MIPLDPILQRLRYRVQSGLPLVYPGARCRIREADAIAVTIDDGPSGGTEKLLDALEANAISATFFLSGEAVTSHPEQARAIVRRGHSLGSHGFAHLDLALTTRDRVEADLDRSLSVIESTTGVLPKLYRPPYGRLNPMHRDLPEARGCAFVLWSSLPGDFDPNVPVEELHRRMDKIHGGDIIVLHDHPHAVERTLSCISFIGELLQRKRLRSVTLS